MRIPEHASALLISDLHLTPSMPVTAQRFFDFCEKQTQASESVFILGDLFEYWVGDDVITHSPFHQEVLHTLARLSTRTKTYYMHGNRDFLIGPSFLKRAGLTLLSDPSLCQLAGDNWVLSHGDALCTADSQYQTFRKVVRQSWIQNLFLKLPIEFRRHIAKQLRSNSTAKYDQALRFMPDSTRIKGDVTLEACANLMRLQNAERLIHGHTHLPARHHESKGSQNWQRWVLSDWDLDHPETILPKASALQIDANGTRYIDLIKA